MGPAVNLASRLEGLCKPLQTDAVFSASVAAEAPELLSTNSHTIKNITKPIKTFILKN